MNIYTINFKVLETFALSISDYFFLSITQRVSMLVWCQIQLIFCREVNPASLY